MAGDFTFLKGNIETIILCALFNGDKYGYEIAKEIKERTQNQYEIKQPTLYSYLKRLETQDLIESYWGAESNGGRRRYYKLTDLGRLHCQAFMNEWQYHKSVLETLVDTSTTPQSTISQEDVTQLFGTKQKKTKRQREVSVESLDDADEISKRLSQLQAQSQPAMEETSAQEDASKTTEVEQVADATATQPVEETKEEANIVISEEDDLHLFDDDDELTDEDFGFFDDVDEDEQI